MKFHRLIVLSLFTFYLSVVAPQTNAQMNRTQPNAVQTLAWLEAENAIWAPIAAVLEPQVRSVVNQTLPSNVADHFWANPAAIALNPSEQTDLASGFVAILGDAQLVERIWSGFLQTAQGRVFATTSGSLDRFRTFSTQLHLILNHLVGERAFLPNIITAFMPIADERRQVEELGGSISPRRPAALVENRWKVIDILFSPFIRLQCEESDCSDRLEWVDTDRSSEMLFADKIFTWVNDPNNRPGSSLATYRLQARGNTPVIGWSLDPQPLETDQVRALARGLLRLHSDVPRILLGDAIKAEMGSANSDWSVHRWVHRQFPSAEWTATTQTFSEFARFDVLRWHALRDGMRYDSTVPGTQHRGGWILTPDALEEAPLQVAGHESEWTDRLQRIWSTEPLSVYAIEFWRAAFPEQFNGLASFAMARLQGVLGQPDRDNSVLVLALLARLDDAATLNFLEQYSSRDRLASLETHGLTLALQIIGDSAGTQTGRALSILGAFSRRSDLSFSQISSVIDALPTFAREGQSQEREAALILENLLSRPWTPAQANSTDVERIASSIMFFRFSVGGEAASHVTWLATLARVPGLSANAAIALVNAFYHSARNGSVPPAAQRLARDVVIYVSRQFPLSQNAALQRLAVRTLSVVSPIGDEATLRRFIEIGANTELLEAVTEDLERALSTISTGANHHEAIALLLRLGARTGISESSVESIAEALDSIDGQHGEDRITQALLELCERQPTQLQGATQLMQRFFREADRSDARDRVLAKLQEFREGFIVSPERLATIDQIVGLIQAEPSASKRAKSLRVRR